MAAPTYEKLRVECERHISSRVEALGSHRGDHASFLHAVDAMWRDHCDHMVMIRNIFLYLDRSYALTTAKVLSIWDLGLRVLRTELEAHGETEEKLIVGLLSMIELERTDQMVDREMMRRLLRMLYSVGMYAEKFQVPFLFDTTRFFRAEGEALMDSTDAANFNVHVERRLVQANDMVVRYLDVSSRFPLLKAIEKELLEPHVKALVERGLGPMLRQHRLSDLKRTYYLLDRVGALPLLCAQWAVHMDDVGKEMVNDEARDKTLVEELLALQEKSEEVLKAAFLSDDSFRVALKKSFEGFVNARTTAPHKPAELLARFVDRNMRGAKGRSESELESLLDSVMVLFSYLSSKDVFEAFYKKMLSKRLLLGKSASADLEKAMLSKLKSECGANYTSKLEGMFKDIELGKNVEKQYKEHLEASSSSSGAGKVETNFRVLTRGFWPESAPVNVAVPVELAEAKSKFEVFYTSRFQGRCLKWVHQLDQCIVTFNLPKGKRELELSFFQMLVLKEFNLPPGGGAGAAEQVLNVADLRAKTGVEDMELRRTLQSLACGKLDTRVLTKEPKGREVDDSDVFRVNLGFSNKLFRVKINTIQLKETQEETEQTHEEVFRDRQYQVDAVIVRTMKARKQLDHNSLVGELLAQLRFPARNSDLKKRIESLIERDYLERDTNDPTIYRYLA